MSEARNRQEVTASQTNAEQTEADVSVPLVNQSCADNNPASESNESSPALIFRILAIFSWCSSDNQSATVPLVAENVTAEIDEFIPGVRRYFKNILGREFLADEENEFRRLFSAWNIYLQQVEVIRDTSAVSSDIDQIIDVFIQWLWVPEGEQKTEDQKARIKDWIPRWNMFLQAREGQSLVTRLNLFLTILGFIFYIVDLVTDIGTSMYYAGTGQWWRAIVTLTIVYGAVFVYSVLKWTNGRIHCTGAADWYRYVAWSLVNWPDVKHYGALCVLEWKRHKSPATNAHLVPEWSRRRTNVAFLKFSEGVWEACPQAILQLYLLMPDLYGAWTWTDYLRISGTSISLCTAGAALVNWDKISRILNYTDLSLSELVVLHVWAVPVTVSRLLSVALVLSVHLYWALAGVALHLVLRGVYWCRTKEVPRTLTEIIAMCQDTLMFFMSPFFVDVSVTYRRVYHAIHFMVNTAMMVVWALGTPLVSAQPVLCTAIMCFNAVLFALGLVGMVLHEKFWPEHNV